MNQIITALAQHACDEPDAIAVRSGVESLTYRELESRVAQCCEWLVSLRVKSVAYRIENGLDWVV
ncbi:MAG: hypothetical protein WD002_14695, partial [Pseudomonadales bacterium]